MAEPNTYPIPALALFALISAFAQPATADSVTLKNGKKFEGIIKHSSGDQVTIDIGLGTVSFHRSQVAAIKKTGTREMKNQWKRRYATQGKFVPDSLQDLSTELSELESARRGALTARSDASRIQRRRSELFAELGSIQNAVNQIATQFQSFDPDRNVQRYNTLVKRQNKLASRAVIVKNRLVTDNDAAITHRETVSAYMDKLSKFEKHLGKKRAEYSDPPVNEDVAVFFKSVDRQIADYSREFDAIEVPHQGQQDHMLLSVRLNDSVEGTFLLDTGATYVTLSDELASRLDLSIAPGNQIPVSLANGAKVNAQPVVLDSVQVGEATANGVIAMIFPEPPSEGVDGLLGMSFLREFIIHLDPAKKTLVFKKFKPSG